MRNLVGFIIKVLPVLIAVALMSCFRSEEDCDPQKQPALTEIEKSFIPNQPGDTLHFKDDAGKKFFLVCKSKTLTPYKYIPEGHANTPCQSIFQIWDRLNATYEGNLLTDNGNLLSLETRIEGGYDPSDPGYPLSCQGDARCSFYLFFKVDQPNMFEQVYFGKTDEKTFPLLINFNFIPEKTLGGQRFQKINATSHASTCTSPATYPVSTFLNSPALDSIYYTAQEGLIRLTTIGGKKYQRVL